MESRRKNKQMSKMDKVKTKINLDRSKPNIQQNLEYDFFLHSPGLKVLVKSYGFTTDLSNRKLQRYLIVRECQKMK
jgi:hypothetical protein